MKKAVVIFAVFLFFALLVIALLFKLLGGSSSSDTPAPTAVQFPVATESVGATDQDPQQFVRSFYEWYLDNFSKDPLFPHPENRDVVLAPWLTPGFLAQWDETVSESEVNPVLLTADDPASWGSAITVKTISESIRSKVLYVTIGSGAFVHAYSIEVSQTRDGTWRIASVASAL